MFFGSIASELFNVAFERYEYIHNNVSLIDIHPALVVDEMKIINGINSEFGTVVKTVAEAYSIVEDERYRRLQDLIDIKFTDDIIINLLDLFESRKDDEINNLTTDNADIQTIFEYVLGIIWYKISGRIGKILECMKLSLDAELFPKSHAAVGETDIIYE